MEKEPRKASEVLLELESAISQILDLVRAQDLNIKIISNKLNSVSEALEKRAVEPPKITVEAVNVKPFTPPVPTTFSEREVPISAESRLKVEEAPKGFRRTSRPESFSGDNSYLPQTKYPTQLPQPGQPSVPLNTVKQAGKPPPGRTAGDTVVVPDKASKKEDEVIFTPVEEQPLKHANQNAVPVTQRVVNGHGKSLWLADVEIVDTTTMETVVKTRCNSVGKWVASLPLGHYRVFVRKLDAASKERLEVSQDIVVDGQQSPLELQTIIVKPN